jgi:hypothetical protein
MDHTKEGWMDGWMDGWMAWMHGCMDEQIKIRSELSFILRLYYILVTCPTLFWGGLPLK